MEEYQFKRKVEKTIEEKTIENYMKDNISRRDFRKGLRTSFEEVFPMPPQERGRISILEKEFRDNIIRTAIQGVELELNKRKRNSY